MVQKYCISDVLDYFLYSKNEKGNEVNSKKNALFIIKYF